MLVHAGELQRLQLGVTEDVVHVLRHFLEELDRPLAFVRGVRYGLFQLRHKVIPGEFVDEFFSVQGLLRRFSEDAVGFGLFLRLLPGGVFFFVASQFFADGLSVTAGLLQLLDGFITLGKVVFQTGQPLGNDAV